MLNLSVFLFSLLAVWGSRGYYTDLLSRMWPGYEPGSFLPTVFIGCALLLAVSFFNCRAIYRKVMSLWRIK